MRKEVESALLAEIAAFVDYMRGLGFRQLNEQEVLEYFLNSGKKSNPRKKGQGIEMGWIYKNDTLTLFVWVSFVPKRNTFKKRDQFWIVIEDSRTDELYYVPMRRTATLLERVKPVVLAHKDLLDHWPVAHSAKNEWKQYLFFEPEKNGAKMYRFREMKSHKRRLDKLSIKITEVSTMDLSEESKAILAAPFVRSNYYCERNIRLDTPRQPIAFIKWCADHGVPVVRRSNEGVDRQPDYNVPDRESLFYPD